MSNETNGAVLCKGFSGSTLKLIAVFSMVIDHIGALLIMPFIKANPLNVYLYVISRSIGRLAYPIFCFLLVEGFIYTHNRKKYALRLLMFALLSEIPYDLARYGRIPCFEEQNVFFSLLIGLVAMWGISYIKEHDIDFIPRSILRAAGFIVPAVYFVWRVSEFFLGLASNKLNAYTIYPIVGLSVVALLLGLADKLKEKGGFDNKVFPCLAVLAISMFAADLVKCDYDSSGILGIVIIYLLRSDRWTAMLASNFVVILPIGILQLPALVSVPIIQRYNGTRGLNIKYLFYVFYPVHMLIIFFVEKSLGIFG